MKLDFILPFLRKAPIVYSGMIGSRRSGAPATVAVEKRVECNNVSAGYDERKLKKRTIPFCTTSGPQVFQRIMDHAKRMI